MINGPVIQSNLADYIRYKYFVVEFIGKRDLESGELNDLHFLFDRCDLWHMLISAEGVLRLGKQVAPRGEGSGGL